jgi:hypothetical protein
VITIASRSALSNFALGIEISSSLRADPRLGSKRSITTADSGGQLMIDAADSLATINPGQHPFAREPVGSVTLGRPDLLM